MTNLEALELAKKERRNKYRMKVKSVHRMKKLNPEFTKYTISKRLKMGYKTVNKILEHEYESWYQEELDEANKK